MTWVRYDDQFPEKPELIAAGDWGEVCGWLHVAATAWCNRQLTDGRVPKALIPRLATFRGMRIGLEVVTAEKVAVRLCAPGVALFTDEGDAYQIVDYLETQPSAATVRARRAAIKERVKRHRDQRGGGGEGGSGNASSNDGGNAVTNDEETGDETSGERVTNAPPVPSRPGPFPHTHRVTAEQVGASGGIGPAPFNCPGDLPPTVGMVAALQAQGCAHPQEECQLYAAYWAAETRLETDWTETGPAFPLWVARHAQIGCAVKAQRHDPVRAGGRRDRANEPDRRPRPGTRQPSAGPVVRSPDELAAEEAIAALAETLGIPLLEASTLWWAEQRRVAAGGCAS